MRSPLVVKAAIAVAVVAAIAGGLVWFLGGDDTTTPTIEELLADLEGRPLSPVEVADQVEVGEMLCALDDPLISAVWREVDPEQLPFHDIVVGRLCPERQALYAARTGRLVTLTETGIDTDISRTTTTTVPPEPTSSSSAGASPPSGSSATTGPSDTTDPTEEDGGTPGTENPDGADGSQATSPTLPPREDLFTTTSAPSLSTVTLDPGT
jgi:hypothetical protein